MGWLSNLFGGSTKPEPEALREAAGASTSLDEPGFRRVGGQDRDLNPMTQARMVRLAQALWEGTPLGHWMIEIPLAFLLAGGVKLRVTGDDENKVAEAQAWIDAFWSDPITDMATGLESRVRELAMFGEQCWPVFESLDGHIRLGYLDPSDIEDVVLDPDNYAAPIGILAAPDADGRKRRYRIIYTHDQGDEDLFGPRAQALRETFTDGDCFFFRVNALMKASRGRSDLLPSADWVDALDQFLFGELERAADMRAWIWDVKITGATQEEVEDRAATTVPPSTGGVRVHNENEEWTTESPDIRAEDGEKAARLFRNHAIGSLGLPEHWFGGGGDVNRASAAEMGLPALRMLTLRQEKLRNILETVGREAIRRRGRVVSRSFALEGLDVLAEFPELVSEDVSRYAAALAQVAAAASTMLGQNLIDRKGAVRLVASLAARLGVEIDPEDTLAQAEEERKAKEERDSIVDPAPDPVDAAEG
jgi:hypothetical protein